MEIKDFKKLLRKLNNQKPKIRLKQLEELLKKEENDRVKKEIKKEIDDIKIIDDERSWKKQELEKIEVRRQEEDTLDTTINQEKTLEDVVETTAEKKDEIKEDIRLYVGRATRVYLSQSGTSPMQTIYTQANISHSIGDLRLEVSRQVARVGVTFDPRWEESLNVDTVNDPRWRSQREAVNLMIGNELITDEKDKEIRKYKLKPQYER